jgi:hypothetical protein
MCCLAIFRSKSDFLSPSYHHIAKLQKTQRWPLWWLLAGIAEHGRSAETSLQMLIVSCRPADPVGFELVTAGCNQKILLE